METQKKCAEENRCLKLKYSPGGSKASPRSSASAELSKTLYKYTDCSMEKCIQSPALFKTALLLDGEKGGAAASS